MKRIILKSTKYITIVAVLFLLFLFTISTPRASQINRYLYILQAYYIPGYKHGVILPPSSYTGVWSCWYKTGELWCKISVKDGAANGYSIVLYRNGNVDRIEKHIDGPVHGVVIYWDENGVLRGYEARDADRVYGLQYYFTPDGKLNEVYDYRTGNKVQVNPLPFDYEPIIKHKANEIYTLVTNELGL